MARTQKKLTKEDKGEKFEIKIQENEIQENKIQEDKIQEKREIYQQEGSLTALAVAPTG